MYSHDTIRERLRQEMERRAINAIELARRAGVKTSFIYDILNGKSTNPSTVKLAMVAESLGIGLSFLAGMPETAGGSGATDMTYIAPLAGGKKGRSEAYASFRHSWLRETLQVAPERLRTFTLAEDSMEPTLKNGDLLLVDTSCTSPSPPGIFVVSDGVGQIVKRLEFTASGNVRVISDNRQHGSYEHPASELNVLGRVIWFGRSL